MRRTIRADGWALAGGCVQWRGRHVDVRYTAGLTRHHGHPELVVCGPVLPRERTLIQALVDQVSDGTRLEPCWLDFGARRLALVEVDQPELLWLSHVVYGREGHRMRALQIVAPDSRGRWPWRDGGRARHLPPLLGRWPFD